VVTSRATIGSVAFHAALIGALIAASTRARGRPPVDIEVVAPVVSMVEPPPPPPRALGNDPGLSGAQRVDLPPLRPEPVRSLPRAPRKAPAVPVPVVVAAAAPASPPDPAVPEPLATVEPPAGTSEQPSGDGAANGGGGTGTGGRGQGNGDGEPDLDHTARARPIDATAAQAQRTLIYTAEAQRDRVSGFVYLTLVVDPLGHVGRATLTRGLGHGLDEIAIKAAMGIRFHPALDHAGNPTVGTVRWRFEFQPP